MQTDTIKLAVTYTTAAVIAIGSLVMAAWAWYVAGDTRDVAIVFGLCGSAFGAASAFLFAQESATRAVRSYQAGLNTPVPASYTVTTASSSDTPSG